MKEAANLRTEETIAAYEFPSLAILKQAHLKLLAMDADAGERAAANVTFLDEVRDFMLRASATGRILDDDKERGVAQTLLNYWATVLFRAGIPDNTFPPTLLADLDESVNRDLDESQCPYCGLEPYSEKTAHLFFGRKDVVAKWLRIITGEKSILVVLGACGSGKTSLIRAGLLPALRKAEGPDSGGHWSIREATLGDVASTKELIDRLEEQSTANGRGLLIVYRVDEGLLSCDRKLQRGLTAALQKWLAPHRGQRKAVFAGRIESSALITQWLQEGELAAQSEHSIVPPFDARELRAVIEQPAARIGLRFDEGLIDTLINEFLGDPASLALLQFTLLKLWDARERNRITWEAYHAMGGGRGAVETTAEGVLQANDIDSALAQKIFLRLVRPTLTSALAVNAIPEADLAPSAELREPTARIVERFAEKRILHIREGANGVRVVEAQEALLRKWPRFWLWLEDARREMLERRRIAEAAAQWREGGRNRCILWTGLLFERAYAIRAQLSPDELEFVLASRSAITRRRIRGYVILIMLSVLLAFAAARAYYKWAETRTDLDIEGGERLVENSDPAGAFLFFVQAACDDPAANNDWRHWIWRRLIFPFRIKADPGPAANELNQLRLGANWWRLPRLNQLFELQDLTRSELSPKGDYLAGTANNEVHLWSLARGGKNEPIDPLIGHPHSRVLWATFSPDAETSLLAVALARPETQGTESGSVIVFDPNSKQLVGKTISITDGVPEKIWFDPAGSGRLLIITRANKGDPSTSISLWNFHTGKPEVRSLACSKPDFEPINWAAFSPDGQLVAMAAGNLNVDSQGEAKIWDWKRDPNTAVCLPHDGGPLAYIEFDAAGKRVLTAEGANQSTRGAARVWSVRKIRNASSNTMDLQTEADTSPLVHRGAVTRARFSPDGLWVATASRDCTTRLWHIRTQKEILNFKQGGDVNDVTFSPDGRYLAAGGRDRNARVWEIATGQPVQAPLNHSETVSEIAYSRDGRSLITSSKHVARVWATDVAEPKTQILQADDSVFATVSDDSQRILTVSGSKSEEPNTLEIWKSTGERIAGQKLTEDRRVRFALLHPDRGRCAVVLSDTGEKKNEVRVLSINAESAGSPHMTELAVFDNAALGGSDILSAQFDPSGDRLALILRKEGVAGNQVALCEIGKRSVRILPGNEGANVSRVQFSPLGKYLLACFTQPPSETGHGKLWRVDGSSSPSSEKLHHATEITTAAFNPKENLLLTGGTDDDAWLWRITDREVTPVYRLNGSAANTHTADLAQVLFSPDGKRALTGARDQTAMLWDLTSGVTGGKCLSVLHHSASVTNAAFSSDGKLILTFSAEPKLRLWSSVTGKLLALLNPTGDVLEAGFAPDNQSVTAIAQSLALRQGWSGAPGEEQFAREIRPMVWNIKPFTLPLAEGTRMGDLIAARQLDNSAVDKAKTDTLPESWRNERAVYETLFDPRMPDNEFFRASALECKGTKQWFAAAWNLSRLLEMAKNDGERTGLLLERAKAYAQADNYAESLPKSIADREAAIKLGRNDAAAYVSLADLHLKYANTFAKAEDGAGEWKASIDDYQEAIKRSPNAADIYLSLGEAFAGDRNYPAAQAAFNKVLELTKASHGNQDYARARLALIGCLIGDDAGKQQYRDICLSLKESTTSNVLLWPAVLTNAFEQDKEFLQEIVTRAQKWAEAAPANYYRRNTYGAALYRAGRYDEASQQLEIARTTYLADRANGLSHRYDHSLRVPIAPSIEGRPVDLLFLAMTNAKLGRSNGWDWMRKARDTPELSQTIRQMSRTNYPIAYENLGLELLYDEAFKTLINMPRPATQTQR
jgi:WD40 repeat protein/tetratricopeptide (TPR) repeat protein